MAEKKWKWFKIADHVNEIDFQQNRIAVIEVNNKKLCIGQHNEKLFAFAYKCPHAGGIMSDGYIDAIGNVVCPLHRYKFSLTNGRNVTGEGYFLKNWPVEEREDGIYVAQEEPNLFGFM